MTTGARPVNGLTLSPTVMQPLGQAGMHLPQDLQNWGKRKGLGFWALS